MWKHDNFINLQLHAGSIPYQITVNGEEYEIQRSRDDMDTTWEMNASINTNLYTIQNNLVVWKDDSILQRNNADVLPTDNVDNVDYTTRIGGGGGGGSMTKQVDLTTLTGWANLSDGEHTITIKAKADGYRDSQASEGVQVNKGGGVSKTWKFNSGLDNETNSDFVVNFQSNGNQYVGIHYEWAGVGLMNYVTDNSTGDGDRVFNKGSWTNTSYRTVVFDNEPTGDLLNWLYTVATPITTT